MIDRTLELVRFARERRGRPFAWGKDDCNTLALEWLDRITGRHDARELALGLYHSAAGAAAHCERLQIRLEDVLRARGAVAVDPRFLHAGDFLLQGQPGEPWQRAHVYMGGGQVLSASPETGVCLLDKKRVGWSLALRVVG